MGRRRADRGGPYGGRLVALLKADHRVQGAAFVAETFHLDPVALLEENDQVKAAIRIAAHKIIGDAYRKANNDTTK